METYKEIIKDKLNELIANGDETKDEILNRWAEGDTQDDFGNLSGSRTFSTYEAKETLNRAGFPFNSEINELFEEAAYNISELLERGAEVIDVVICELLVGSMIDELRK